MARYTDAKCRICRREGKKLFLKGDKCSTAKCPVEKRPNLVPGQHGQRKGRLTDFGVMLREKQMLKRSYCLLEKQFKKHYEEAERRKGPTGENLLVILESRLDSIIYKMGYGSSRSEARQLVSHKSITVNGRIVNIPSYEVKPGDEISINEKQKNQLRIQSSLKTASDAGLPEWLEVDATAMTGKMKQLPERTDLSADIKEHLVVELYSK